MKNKRNSIIIIVLLVILQLSTIFSMLALVTGFLNRTIIKSQENNIPYNIIESFYEDNGIIILNDDEMLYKYVKVNNNTSDFYDIAGFYCTDNSIFIKDDMITILSKTLYHEIGHYIDNITQTSESEEFINIRDLEFTKSKFDDYYLPSEEYFAESVRLFIAHPYKLKHRCPMTYEYINNIIVNWDKKEKIE